MKKNFWKLLLYFVSGVFIGMFIRLSVTMIGLRPSSMGGELLIIPLIILMIYFGYCLGMDDKTKKHLQYYRSGYDKGTQDAASESEGWKLGT